MINSLGLKLSRGKSKTGWKCEVYIKNVNVDKTKFRKIMSMTQQIKSKNSNNEKGSG